MKIKLIKGDLLDFSENINIIFHGCNIENTMGAGLAKQIKYKIPEMYNADTMAYKTGNVRLGGFSFAKFQRNKKIYYGYNLYQQSLRNYSKWNIPLDYEALKNALTNARNHISMIETTENIKPILGFPFLIGCDLAGGNVNLVTNIIRDVFKTTNYSIYFVKYEKRK